MTCGRHLIKFLNECEQDSETKFIREKLELYLQYSVKQYNGNKERGEDEFICGNFANLMTDYVRYFMNDSSILLNRKKLNTYINLLWYEINNY